MFDNDAHSQVVARMPAKDAPAQEWADHYEWAAGVYEERRQPHWADVSRRRAAGYRQELEAQ
jgi:hypothetical protein